MKNKNLDLKDFDLLALEAIRNNMLNFKYGMERAGLKKTSYKGVLDNDWRVNEMPFDNQLWLDRKLWENSVMILGSGVRKGQHVLDAGGASSLFSFYLAHEECNVNVSDLDVEGAGTILNANHVAKQMEWPLTAVVEDISAMEWPDEQFDHVFCICTLEHLEVEKQKLALHEFQRVLKPGGRLGLTFDYGPAGFGEKYTAVTDIQSRILDVVPEMRLRFGPFEESDIWFEEHPGKSWACLFLEKPEPKAGKHEYYCPSCRNAWLQLFNGCGQMNEPGPPEKNELKRPERLCIPCRKTEKPSD